jgi:hypothetical protein
MRRIAILLGLVVVASASAASLPQAGRVVGTLRFPVRETELFAARNGRLFVLVLPESYGHRFSVVRVDRNGRAARKLRFPLTPYIWSVVAGPDGLYVGTCVIRRFVSARDQLLRIDPMTLKVRARAFFPGMVTLVARGSRLWATIGTGDVVRLNPQTLAVEARKHVVGRLPNSGEEAPLYSPALGLGSLWVLAGDRTTMALVRLDPTSLAIRSRTRLRRDLAGTISQVVAGPRGAFLVGYAVAAVDPRGRVGRTIPEPELGAAAVYGSGLVGVTPAGVELLDARGRVRATTHLLDAGNPLALVGRELWLTGNAGPGFGLVHIRLAAAPPFS